MSDEERHKRSRLNDEDFASDESVETDDSVSGPTPRKTLRLEKNFDKQIKRATRRKKRRTDDDSDYTGYPSPSRSARNFEKAKNRANKFSESRVIPEIFKPLITRLSNVKQKILMTGKVNGFQRNILLLGEMHSKINLDAGMHEIVKTYLSNVSDNVDFMFEISPRMLTVPINGTSILNNVRNELAPYIKYDNSRALSFPNARVHWIDMDFRLTKRSRPFIKFLSHLLKAENGLSGDGSDIQDNIDEIEKLLLKYGNLARNTMSQHPSRDDRYILFVACLHFLKNSFPINTLKKCTLLSDAEYFLIFEDVYRFVNALPSYLWSMHRFLMDVYTCCRMLKVDEPWYKNIILYAGFLHTGSCAHILERYGFRANRVHYNREFPGVEGYFQMRDLY